MTALPSQDAPAFSPLDKVKTALSSVFSVFAKADPAEAERKRLAEYRERLCAAERTIFDEFHRCQESHPDHAVFIGIYETCKPDRYEVYETVDAAQVAIKAMGNNKRGPKPFIAFDLQKSFLDQWTERPDGRDWTHQLKGGSPISRVSAIWLPTNNFR